ncbi:FAD-dependent oxidoreductase, partial [Escherichia coli]|nr:FAD-dependent oxidoreductase [Escherichia coli]
FVQSLSIPIPVQSALVIKNQAQFHPLLYLKTLLEKFVEMGGKVYEQTTAIDVETGDSPQVITKGGHRITCEYVVSCSHFPFYDSTSFFFTR